MINKRDIIEFIKKNRPELIAQFHLSKIGIFGSIARGEQTDKSDIDLIVEFENGTENLSQIKQALRNVFEQQFHTEVDICREKYIKPYYKEQILKDAIFV